MPAETRRLETFVNRWKSSWDGKTPAPTPPPTVKERRTAATDRTAKAGRTAYLNGLYRKYGLSEKQVAELYAESAGRCEICHSPFTLEKGAVVDHCHTTGKVRGLLCNSCNGFLGDGRDNPAMLKAAIHYLES